MTQLLTDALALARRDLPGWASDLLAKAANPEVAPSRAAGMSTNVTVDSLGDLLKWAAERGSVLVSADSEVLQKDAGVAADSEAQLRAAARYAFDRPLSKGLIATSGDGDTCFLKAEGAYDEVGLVVPSAGPRRPLVAFVGVHPSHLDAARGEPFCGPYGRTLVDQYLAPLGLTKADVLLTHLLPVAGEVAPGTMAQWVGWVQKELSRFKPAIVVALGKEARETLGALAHFTMPHPAVISRRGDTGEVVRKVRAIKERMEVLTKFDKSVVIAKSDTEKQITYGVPLDPYQFDSHKDWIPASEIEQTAHNFLVKYRVIGLQHQGAADADVVESHIVHYPSKEDYTKAMHNEPHRAYRMQYGNQQVHSGAWILGTRINDAGTWAAIQKGDITAYSIGGCGVKTPVKPDAIPKVEFIDIGAIPS